MPSFSVSFLLGVFFVFPSRGINLEPGRRHSQFAMRRREGLVFNPTRTDAQQSAAFSLPADQGQARGTVGVSFIFRLRFRVSIIRIVLFELQ